MGIRYLRVVLRSMLGRVRAWWDGKALRSKERARARLIERAMRDQGVSWLAGGSREIDGPDIGEDVVSFDHDMRKPSMN